MIALNRLCYEEDRLYLKTDVIDIQDLKNLAD